MLRVVLDPGVVVSGLFNPAGPPGLLLQAWREGRFELIVSPNLLVELTDVLSRPKFTSRLDPSAIAELLRLLPEAATMRIDPEPTAMSRDPDDDYLVALAQESDALLISGDQDLLTVVVEGMEILSPSEAVMRLRTT